LRGEFTVADETYRFRLIRSAYSTADTLVAIPRPQTAVSGSLHYKRYPTNDDFTAIPLQVYGDQLGARLPAQPPAGKLEYFLTLETAQGSLTIPDNESGSVVMRYKGPTPVYVLLPHVVMMFFAVLLGMRAGLAALFAPAGMTRLSWTTLGLVTVGGMILGPIVQQSAFGAYWTGFPLGYDLTDNKTLIMWLAWAAACLVLLKCSGRELVCRTAVMVAAVVMVVVYLIPHSLRGSELDYSQLEQGGTLEGTVEAGG
jgi:hypothetical protein